MTEPAYTHPDIKKLIPYENGTDVGHDPSSALGKPHQQELRVCAALRQSPSTPNAPSSQRAYTDIFPTKNLNYNFFVTGPYADADPALFLSARSPDAEETGTFDVQRKRAILLGDVARPMSLTTMHNIGHAVVATLLRPTAARGRALRISSFTTTPQEIAAHFEQQSGGEKWDVGFTSPERLRELDRLRRGTIRGQVPSPCERFGRRAGRCMLSATMH